MDNNEVWPPPPDGEKTAQSGPIRQCSKAATILGVLSLVLTLPGFLLIGINDVTWKYLHTMAWYRFISQYNYVFEVVMFLPAVGWLLEICAWRSIWGKLGVASAIIYGGFIINIFYHVYSSARR